MSSKSSPLPFKQRNTVDSRRAESERLRDQHPTLIPVICEKTEKSNVPRVDRIKYLVPESHTVSQFMMTLRNRIQVSESTALFLFVDKPSPSYLTTFMDVKIIPHGGQLMIDVYREHKDEDGFLYIVYSGENTFGA